MTGTPVELYKVRARNSDNVRGKSGGYRIIYQRTPEHTIVLITLYSKTEQSDISPTEIQRIIESTESPHQAQHSPPESSNTDPES